MSSKKEKLLKKAMQEFHEIGGGTEVDPEFTTNNPEILKAELQSSFDKIFPELIKKEKHRNAYRIRTDLSQPHECLSALDEHIFCILNQKFATS